MVGAAPRLAGRLRGIAFVSAFVPRGGESMADAMGPDIGAYLRAAIEASPDHTMGVDFAAFRESLMQDEPENLQRLVFGVDHDIKVYPGAGHGFINNHDPADMMPLLTFLSTISGTRYHEPSAVGAHRRIAAFFTRHLTA